MTYYSTKDYNLNQIKRREDLFEQLEMKVGSHHTRCPSHGGSDSVSCKRHSGNGHILWRCHNCDAGGTIVDAYAAAHGLSVDAAIRQLCGLPEGDVDGWRLQHREEHAEINVRPGATTYDVPLPDERAFRRMVNADEGEAVSLWVAPCEFDGEVHALGVCRLDRADGSKEIRQAHWCEQHGWCWSLGNFPSTWRPLYHLDKVVAGDFDELWIVEGEKCMDAVQQAVERHANLMDAWKTLPNPPREAEAPKVLVTTCVGGSKGIKRTDLTPLKDIDESKIRIWIDNDEPGRAFGAFIQRQLSSPRVYEVAIDSSPEGYDIADYLEGGDVSFLLRKQPVERNSSRRPRIISNFEVEEIEGEDGRTRQIKKRRELPDIISSVFSEHHSWPRMVDGDLVVRARGYGKLGEEQIACLESATQLTSWLQMHGELEWTRGNLLQRNGKAEPVKRAELFEGLKLEAEKHDRIETIPHVPKRRGVLYTTSLQRGRGEMLERFLTLFNPDSEQDRHLIEAALLTPMWGGLPGTRPIFVLTTDHGQGAGKTSTVEAISRVYGGHLTKSLGEGWETFMQRIFSQEALGKRIILVDNLTGRVTSPELAGFVTSETISGKKLYVGESRTPNLFSWFLTSNNARLNTDITERSVIIKIGAPCHNVDFRTEVARFLDNHRRELLEDIYGKLNGSRVANPTQYTRFQAWEKDVLARVHEPDALIELIRQRQSSADEETQHALEIKAVLEEYLESRGFELGSAHVLIPSGALCEIFSAWAGEPLTSRKMWSLLCGPIEHRCLRPLVSRATGGRAGRGLVWKGPSASSSSPTRL